MWILGIEFHEFVKEDMGHGCHSHGRTRVSRIGFCSHVNCQTTDCVDAFPIEFTVRRFRHCGETARIPQKSRLDEELAEDELEAMRV